MITTIKISGFLPFREEVTLPLADQGLILVRGRNLVSAAADSNGVGKTSIINALSWGDFGEDLSGRRSDDVACRFTTGPCIVQVDHLDAIGAWSVLRTRRPASLQVVGIPGVEPGEDMAVTQRRIEARLGYGLRTFRNAVIFGQGAFDRFASADQAEQMRMLDEIRGLDFTHARKRAKDWRDQLQAQKMATDSAVTVLLVEQRQVQLKIDELTTIRNTYEVAKTREVEALTYRLADSLRKLQVAKNDMAQAVKDEKLFVKLTDLEKKDKEAERLAGLAGSESETQHAALQARLDDIRALEDRLDSLLEDNACPTCRGPVTSKAAVRKRFAKEFKELEARKDEQAEAVDLAVAAERLADLAYSEANQRFVNALPSDASGEGSSYLFTLQVRLSAKAAQQRQVMYDTFLKDSADLERQRGVKDGEQWVGATKLAEAAEAARVIVEQLAKHNIRTIKLGHAITIADYWVEAVGDKGIRSLLVDADAEFINSRLRFHLEELAGGEVQVVMSAQTALKKGGARERISFTPTWTWGGQGAGTGSGGQDRRVDLAVFASIQDLAERRSVRPFPLKVWDEPGDALDARGQELFIRWVTSEARRRGTGLLVTHSAQLADQAEPDHIWTVVMDKRGARVEVSDT